MPKIETGKSPDDMTSAERKEARSFFLFVRASEIGAIVACAICAACKVQGLLPDRYTWTVVIAVPALLIGLLPVMGIIAKWKDNDIWRWFIIVIYTIILFTTAWWLSK